jgi:hypothetical protein
MGSTIFGWLVVILIGIEFGVVAYLRRDRYPRFLFSIWAPALYLAMIAADCLLAALLSVLLGTPTVDVTNGRTSLLTVSLVAGLLAGVIALLTLFFQWVLRTNITDPPE